MAFRKMLGGGKFPALLEENRGQYDNSALPQLQLVGHVPIQYDGGNTPTDNRPMKRIREDEPIHMQPKLGVSLNNNDDTGYIGILLNPNRVSTGLRLSREKEEGSPAISSACEDMKKGVLSVLSLGNTIKMEIDRQTEEFGRYIKLQEESLAKGVRELTQRHTVSLLNTLEKRVTKKLHEKEVEIENINRKNKELEDRIKQVTMEAQSWHYRAKYNESVANGLKNNIQQLMAQGTAQGTAQGREGSGESEVDDAISYTNQEVEDHRLKCRGCKGKNVSILLLPCRHLCLCADCEGFIDICPICQVMKSASVLVFM